jgi:Ku protein
VIYLDQLSVEVDAYRTLDWKKSCIRMNHLHKRCGHHLRRQQVCPQHGEVSPRDIVKGYPCGGGRHVTFTQKELDSLRPKTDLGICLVRTVPAHSVDAFRFKGLHFLLLPSTRAARLPYETLRLALTEANMWCIALAMYYQRERLVLLRGTPRLLAISELHYLDAVRSESALEAKLKAIGPPLPQVVQSAMTSIEDLHSKDHHPDEVSDPYIQSLEASISAKRTERKRRSW